MAEYQKQLDLYSKVLESMSNKLKKYEKEEPITFRNMDNT